MNEIKIFDGKEVEVIDLNGHVLFNPYHVGNCLELADSSVRNYLAKMNNKQAVKIKNSDVQDKDIRKLNNAGEKFLTESGVYKLVFKSNKPNAEEFTDWISDEVLPSIRKTGTYETLKAKEHRETLASVNNAVKIITPFLVNAGCSENIQLLTVKGIYEKAGINIPIDIKAEQKFFSTEYIARELKMRTSSGRPAIGAVNEIIRKVGYTDGEFEVVFFDNHGHQGTTNQYSQVVVDRVAEWLSSNNYPLNILYTDKSGNDKAYHVVYS